MFKAATLLKDARLDKELDLADIGRKIKIPSKYLEAIESGCSTQLPPEPYCSLYVKAYADFLGLSSQHVLSVFRRDFDHQPTPDKGFRHHFHGFTPQFTFALGIIALIFLFSAYLANEYIKFSRPPRLTINWPTATVVGSTYDLTGTTDSSATVRINRDLVIVDSSGAFSKYLTLSPPETKVQIEARSPNGKITTEEKTIKSN